MSHHDIPWKKTPLGTACTVTQEWVEKQGFFTNEMDPKTNMRRTCVPVVLTPAAWKDCVEWRATTFSPEDKAAKENTRLWDVLWMCSMKVNDTGRKADVGYLFQIYRLPNGGKGKPPKSDEECGTLLKAVYGTDANDERILTIMLPDEI
ncbi:DUF6573 family protein [Rhodoferax sp.]|uniref:DUF6573 family protein n=1 Tax=Rhodoferax sp. TaxID=50421 RepID=UPI0027576583|nr:hypothetical protein [Rhodoferax sp.]